MVVAAGGVMYVVIYMELREKRMRGKLIEVEGQMERQRKEGKDRKADTHKRETNKDRKTMRKCIYNV